ncbi:hypothetical protein ONZ45_g14458 [Pleurotus djamor]|nr:hypothetical protein ONZ45_g14458 [Pleurotus djamor]
MESELYLFSSYSSSFPSPNSALCHVGDGGADDSESGNGGADLEEDEQSKGEEKDKEETDEESKKEDEDQNTAEDDEDSDGGAASPPGMSRSQLENWDSRGSPREYPCTLCQERELKCRDWAVAILSRSVTGPLAPVVT